MSYLRRVPMDESTYPPFVDIKRDYGFVPNFWKAQTIRPELIEAEMVMVKSILIDEKALTRRQKEYIFLVCSAANLSTYCVTAHCEIIRMLGIEGPEPEQVAIDHTATRLPVVDKALLNFALKLNREGSNIAVHDIEALRTYGFSDAEILETILIVGLAQFANVVSFGLGTLPDFENAKLALGRARGEGH